MLNSAGFASSIFPAQNLAAYELLQAKDIFFKIRSELNHAKSIRASIALTEYYINDASKYLEFLKLIEQLKPIIGIDRINDPDEAIKLDPKRVSEHIAGMHLKLELLQNQLKRNEFDIQESCFLFISSFKRPLLLKRIQMVWENYFVEEKFRETGSVDQYIKKHTIIVVKAIEQECIILFLENMVQHINTYLSGHNNDLAAIKHIYDWLPQYVKYYISIDCALKDRENEKELSIEEETDFKAIKETILKELARLNSAEPFPNEDICDETIQGLFFEVRDHLGNLKACILGSYHELPANFLKFRREIRKAFQLATAVLFERDFSKECSLDEFSSYWGCLHYVSDQKNYYGHMDGHLCCLTLERNKWIIGLEDPHESILEAENSNAKSVPSLSTPRNKDVDEEWGVWLDKKVYDIMRTGDLNKLSATIAFYLKRVFHPIDLIADLETMKKRNEIQANGVSNFLEAHPDEQAFVVVGMGHLPDVNYHVGQLKGVISLLREKGYKIKQI